jgi:hypothetical protein
MDEVHDFMVPRDDDTPEMAARRKHVRDCVDVFWFGVQKEEKIKVTNTQKYKTLLSIVFAILVMLVFMFVVSCESHYDKAMKCQDNLKENLEECQDDEDCRKTAYDLYRHCLNRSGRIY